MFYHQQPRVSLLNGRWKSADAREDGDIQILRWAMDRLIERITQGQGLPRWLKW